MLKRFSKYDYYGTDERLFVYELGFAIIDDGWQFLPSPDDVANKIAVDSEHWNGYSTKEFAEFYQSAKEVFKRDVCNDHAPDFQVLWIPDCDQCVFEPVFIQKISDNGTMFIISKIDLINLMKGWKEQGFKRI